jgi:mannosyltransferase
VASGAEAAPAAVIGREPAPGDHPPRGPAWARTAAWAVPAAIALVLSVHRSFGTPVWRDEYATAAYAALDLPDLIQAVSRVDAVFGPYYLLMHALAPALGGDGPWLRLPSVVAFVVATALVGVIALRWWGAVPAAAAGTALAVNPALLAQAVNARPYLLSIMFVLIAVLALDVAMGRTGRRLAWIVAGAAGVLAVAMHLFAMVALATTAVLLVGRSRKVGAWLAAGAPAAVVAALVGFLGAGQTGQLTWLTAPDVREAIAILADVASVATDRAVLLDAVLLAASFAMLALVVTVMARAPGAAGAPEAATRWERLRPVLFSAALLLAPWLVLSAGSWLLSPMLTERYVLWSAAGAALSIGAGAGMWTRPRPRTPMAIAAGVLAVALLALSVMFSVERMARLEPHPGVLERVVDELEGEADPGDRLVLVQRYWEGGVAREFAAASDDEAYADELVARLPAGGQPLVDVRRITSTDPLRTELDAGAPGAGDVVWVLTIHPLTDEVLEELAPALDPALAACLGGVSSGTAADVTDFDEFDLTRVDCAAD